MTFKNQMKKIILLSIPLFVVLFLIASIFVVPNKTLAENSWNVGPAESNISTCQFVNLLTYLNIINSNKADHALTTLGCNPTSIQLGEVASTTSTNNFATTTFPLFTTTSSTTLNSWHDLVGLNNAATTTALNSWDDDATTTLNHWDDDATTTNNWLEDLLADPEATTTATSTNTFATSTFAGDTATTTVATTTATTTVSSRYQVFFGGYIEKIEDCLTPNPNKYKMITIKPCGGSGNIVSSVNSAPEPGGPMKYASDYVVSPGGSLTGLFYPGYGDREPQVGDSVLGVADSNHEARCLTASMKAAKIEVSSLGKSVGIVKQIGSGSQSCSVAPTQNNQNNNSDSDWLTQLIQALIGL